MYIAIHIALDRGTVAPKSVPEMSEHEIVMIEAMSMDSFWRLFRECNTYLPIELWHGHGSNFHLVLLRVEQNRGQLLCHQNLPMK